jgi:tetratricopeptide (TPR) repeat protein
MVFLILYAAIGISGFMKLQGGQKFVMSNQMVLGVFMLSTLFSVYVINSRLGSAKAAKKAVDAFGKRNARGMMLAGQEAAQTYYSLDDFGNPVAFFEGMGQLASKNTKGAENAFGRALEAHPYHILSNIQMGNTLKNISRFAEAEEYYDRALAVSPLNEQALLNRVEVSLLQNNWQKALEDLRCISPNVKNQRYLNAVKQTMSEYYRNPPTQGLNGMDNYLKGAQNPNELSEKFINWKTRALEKQKKTKP